MSNWRCYVSHVNWSGPARNTLASPLRLRKRANPNTDHRRLPATRRGSRCGSASEAGPAPARSGGPRRIVNRDHLHVAVVFIVASKWQGGLDGWLLSSWVSEPSSREGRGNHAAGRELGAMLMIRKSYRRVVRDARRRDTAELARIERALRRNVQSLDNGALTNLFALRAVLRARGVELPPLGRGAARAEDERLGSVGVRCGGGCRGSHSRPARLSTLAGTPTSRSAAALTPVRFAHEAATFTNASSSSGSRAAWSSWAS
jgi:hypothetical protein